MYQFQVWFLILDRTALMLVVKLNFFNFLH
uniref:Uncharacterized protein n=1 Tax=Lepeophtheirus salmonis TaxID=72036 RepID=A0A0K2ULK3_LEPSM